MTVASALVGFAAFAAVLTLIPGLDTTLVLRSAVSRSKTYAFATALGIQSGVIVWGIVTALGATVLLAASETAYRLLTIAGALYLVWMGVAMVRAGFRTVLVGVGAHASSGGAPEASQGDEASLPEFRGNAWKGFGIGVMTNLLNLKVGVFYLATIPQFVPAGVSPLLMGVLLALVHAVLGTVWCSVVIGGGRALAKSMRTPRLAQWIDRIAGGVIVAFGAALAVESVRL